MHFNKQSLKLYAVTDRTWLKEQTLQMQIEMAVKAGVTMVQLREKTLSKEAFIQEAVVIKRLLSRYGVPLIINDDVQIARLSGADGVHLGQEDLSPTVARTLLGPDKIIGVTARTPKQAYDAFLQSADYIGSGALFGSQTKQDAKNMSYETLKSICQSTPLPVVAIGGIDESNILQLAGSGITGVAVVSALFASPDIAKAARTLSTLATKVVTV